MFTPMRDSKKMPACENFPKIFILSCLFGIKSVNIKKRTFVDVAHHFHIQLVIQNHGRQRREGCRLYPHPGCGGSSNRAIREFITARGRIFASGGKIVKSASKDWNTVSVRRQSARGAQTFRSGGSLSPWSDRN